MLILTYFRTGNCKEVMEYNSKLRKEIENHAKVAENKECNLMILGDFNGHLGYLGNQEENNNGKITNEMLQKNDLILLNIDENCQGVYTWQRGKDKSVIDLVMVNQRMYQHVRKIFINDERNRNDLSDHNLIQVDVNIKMLKKKKNLIYERQYYSTEKDALDEYLNSVKERIIYSEDMNIQILNEIMHDAANSKLLRTYRRRIDEDKNSEPSWMTNNIKKEIDIRKIMNRKQRNESNEVLKEQYFREYREQKLKASNLINKEIWKFESKQVKSIMENTNNSRNLFLNIKKLKGDDLNRSNKLDIFKNGAIIDEEKTTEEIKTYWGKIYEMHENKINNNWNDETKEKYCKNLKNIEDYGMEIVEYRVLTHYNEHLDMAIQIQETRNEDGVSVATVERNVHNNRSIRLPDDNDDKYRKMSILKLDIEEEQIETILKKLKNNKSPGPDGLKNELYKKLAEDRITLDALTECYKNIIEEENPPQEWKQSTTVMIPKNRKPTVDQLRPLALTNVSYKIFMSLIKDSLEKHIISNDMTKENQSGFTKGGRVQDNLFILKEMIEDGFLKKIPIIIIALDFKKAYDSIKREEIIEILKDYRVQKELIDFIALIYQGDSTNIKVNEREYIKMEISNGIRQGCTASAVIFKLITFKIIEKIETNCGGIQYGRRKINSLFFADDGLLLSNSVDVAIQQMEKLNTEAAKYGLKVNREKSKSMIFNMVEQPEEISGMEVVKNMKYLGVEICAQRDLFCKQRDRIVLQAGKMANMSYSVMMKSCHKILIGKAYWKTMVLPSVLYGAELVIFRESDLNTMQIAENRVLRCMMQGPSYAPIAAMQGEVGITNMKVRIIRMKLQYFRTIKQGEKNILKEVLNNMIRRESKWYKDIRKYIEWLNLTENQLEVITKEELNKIISEKADKEWKEELYKKSSLKIYRKNIDYIGNMTTYDNKPSSKIWFRARSNCLQLNDRKRFNRSDTKCELCEGEREDLIHFILECKALNKERLQSVLLQRPWNKDVDDIIGQFLFDPEDHESKRELLYWMWKLRGRLIKENIYLPV